MRIRVKIPKLGLTIEEVTLTTWEKAEGDNVKAGETIASVEGDKATFEVASPIDGVLAKQIITVGEAVPIGTEIAIVEG